MLADINRNIIESSSYFLRLLIITAFVSVTTLLLDLPHQLSLWWSGPAADGGDEVDLARLRRQLLESKKIKRCERRKMEGESPQDLYIYSIGFNIAFN